MHASKSRLGNDITKSELVDLEGYACVVKLRLNKRCYPGLLSLEIVFLSWMGYIILNSGFL
ncbi:hypothetical protein HanRHA438_Chr10g0448731 [Helianthus annuus]|uniref:Uncharacterized protein n=1 Tax=Helianthus annuus TaxID=4232 RepID=A0A9K3HXE7_HELAN|nr:hypothetical protein HanXRQr2_Chr10g0436641 [Helianthus annuus]KAJ0513528.1 hypothetical protein HanHA300_Chr10g0358621 [Helianthus annuus]KAJ0529660.1 hypothetical protein HanHA89_Chr10g0380531 [Helianthus annuus]KAJ0699987.1 hypothetical protein HanOQP8_Chr10g0362431 [Helianthus annuus]KAJ0879207.1 hypothetical protein HanRHA438_Chr10g0448731 [Helianthus annuus]